MGSKKITTKSHATNPPIAELVAAKKDIETYANGQVKTRNAHTGKDLPNLRDLRTLSVRLRQRIDI